MFHAYEKAPLIFETRGFEASDDPRRAFWGDPALVNEVRALLTPAGEAFFPGRSDRRTAAVFIPAWAARFVPTIDLRDWKAFRAWATGLAPLLVPDPVR